MNLLIVAATPFDADLGVRLFSDLHLTTVSVSLSAEPKSQTILQFDQDELTRQLYKKLDTLALLHNFDLIVIYCNSLSGVLNLKLLEERYGLPIITPLTAYQAWVSSFNVLGIIAANSQGVFQIEKYLLKIKSSLNIIGFSLVDPVVALEAGKSAKEVIKQYHFSSLCQLLDSYGCEVIILGCTHFSLLYPSLKDMLKKLSIHAQLLEPSEYIRQKVTSMLP